MFKVLDEMCQPTKATKYSAGIDLYAREDVVIGAGDTVVVPLGVKIDLDNLFSEESGFGIDDGVHDDSDALDFFMRRHHLELFNRSSTALKRGLILANGTGIIDLDFKDEIGAILHNPIDLDAVDLGIRTIILGTELSKNDFSKDEIEKSCKEFADTQKHKMGRVEIKKGDKICQIILKENKTYLMGIASDEERTGGFGSSGER